MTQYLIRRILQGFLLVWLVTLMAFVILHLIPGGPASQYAETPGMTQEQIDRLLSDLGLDRPLHIQYFDWLSGLLTGDWGRSYRNGLPVLEIIGSRLFATFTLMVSATSVAIFIGVLVGVLSALRPYSLFDQFTAIGAMVALSIPTFWFGLMVIYLFAIKLGWLPPGNMFTVGKASFLDFLHHLIAPALVLGLVGVATWSRFMRSSMLDVIGQDYVRTAVAKGLPQKRILIRHVLKNALLPMITLAGMELPALLSGALVTETVFTWPGMGRLFLDSVEYRDYPVIMGVLVLSSLLVIVGSLLADILYVVADPRIRLS